MMRHAAISSWASCFLVVALIFRLVTIVDCQKYVSAVTNSKTTLLNSYGASSNVITTLAREEVLVISCRIQDAYVFDDPWWLNVTVPAFGIQGWVADYYVNCGYIGFCQADECILM